MNFEHKFQDHFSKKGFNNSTFDQALAYAIGRPGKRLRPHFAIESGSFFQLPEEALFSIAAAVELIHLFSLVHDDLPCMDDDDIRSGLPTLHKKFDEATALLVGDELFNLGYQTFLESAPFVDSQNFVLALSFFSQCIGRNGMIGGQSQELTLGNATVLEELLHVQDLKTGALFRAAILCPALLAGHNENEKAFLDLKQFATDFGFAFQIADDLEDEVQDVQNVKNGFAVKNVLALMGKENAVKLARDRLTQSPVASKFSATPLLLSKLGF